MYRSASRLSLIAKLLVSSEKRIIMEMRLVSSRFLTVVSRCSHSRQEMRGSISLAYLTSEILKHLADEESRTSPLITLTPNNSRKRNETRGIEKDKEY
ncbi:hypothetical protein PUN28_020249 [Cardiocondyla obscurior]|uniref:Uncharacterized protein n=1 Tax=Cardiocondyla obscurior TaxID=286306 RepID=A0AAW2E5V9_9HYME